MYVLSIGIVLFYSLFYFPFYSLFYFLFYFFFYFLFYLTLNRYQSGCMSWMLISVKM